MTTLTNGQAELRAGTDAALVIGDGTDFDWTADGPLWWSGTEVRTSDQARSGANGYVVGRDLLGKHTSTIQAYLLGDTEAELGDRIDAWKAACAYASDELVTVRLCAFGRTRRRVGRFRIPGDVSTPHARTDYFAIGSAQFEALDPLTYGDDLQSDSTQRRQDGAGFAVPFDVPFDLPASVGGSFTITNAGNVAAPWTARLDGPLTYPEITHLESGRRLSLAFSANGGVDLATGEYLDLDSASRSVLLNGTADRRTQLTIDSTWWDLDPGANTFELAADAGAGTLTVSAYDAFYS